MTKALRTALIAMAFIPEAIGQDSNKERILAMTDAARLCEQVDREMTIETEEGILLCLSGESFGTKEQPRELMRDHPDVDLIVFPRPVSKSEYDDQLSRLVIPERTVWSVPPSPDMVACSLRIREATPGEPVDCSDIYQ